jgi:hypothetical protein
MRKLLVSLVAVLSPFLFSGARAQQKYPFDGLQMGLGTIQKVSDAETRSISPENYNGGKGKGGMATLVDSVNKRKAIAGHQSRQLGQGWKLNPCIWIKAGETFTIADITGPGQIQHIWMTPSHDWRLTIMRIYWDDEKTPSVEAPVGDFFCQGWDQFAQVSSMPIAVNPGSGFNSYWPMPFRKHCRITLDNMNRDSMLVFYSIDYTLTKVAKDDAYFHAQYRCNDPNSKDYHSIYTIIDGIKGKGQYVGTYMAWGVNNWGWWGEGEIKMFIDGDKKLPTINGTGTEDYFLGSYGFGTPEDPTTKYTTPFVGVPQVIKPDKANKQKYDRIGMYRWHIMDPVRFKTDLKVTMEDLGWKDYGQTYLDQKSNISSVAYWYQLEPHNPFPKFPSADQLVVK